MVLGSCFIDVSPVMKNWVSGLEKLACRCKDWIFDWVSAELNDFESGILLFVINKVVFCLLTFVFTLGGATIGTITGAIKGHTTETGLFRGAGVGAVAGAITAVQLLDLIANGEPFSKVALICSLVNGKIFMEWVSPAVLKAYQWQISTMDTNSREISDIFDVNATRGLSPDIINSLPIYHFPFEGAINSCQEISCAICLLDFKKGDVAKMLQSCRHHFHSKCIDEWLSRHGNCPICRREV